MNELKEMNDYELQAIEGGFDPVSWGIGFLLGTVVNGVVEATTGQGLSGWVSDGLKYAYSEMSNPNSTFSAWCNSGAHY